MQSCFLQCVGAREWKSLKKIRFGSEMSTLKRSIGLKMIDFFKQMNHKRDSKRRILGK